MAALMIVLSDLIIFGGFAAWQLADIEGARNLYLFVTWGIAITIIVLIPFSKVKPQKKSHIVRRIWKYVRLVFVVGSSVWIGMMWLAAAWVVAALFSDTYTEQCEKAVEDGNGV